MTRQGERLAIVMAGGGARAAYQVGVLRGLAKRCPDLRLPIITGVSAGAINAVHLARRQGSFTNSVEDLTAMWASIRTQDVLRASTWSLLSNVFRWALRLVSGGAPGAPSPRGMVDTAPLRDFLCRALGTEGMGAGTPIPYVADNVQRGVLDAVALTSTSYGTGQSVTWVQGRDVVPWERPLRRAESAELCVEHVMASAALPLLFPAVRIGQEWHGDGGVRQMAPLSPALHLGADSILAIATRRSALPRGLRGEFANHYPPPAQVVSVLVNAVFLDALDYDAMMMQRVNRLARMIPDEGRAGIREVNLLVVRPSEDLGLMAAEHEVELPRMLRFLLRGWGTNEVRAPDSLAMLMFENSYVCRLIELGERDADDHAAELERFIECAQG